MAASFTRPLSVIAPVRSVMGAVSLMRLLIWICKFELLSRFRPPELSSIPEVLRMVASSCRLSVLPERTVNPV